MDVLEFFRRAVDDGASDLFLLAGSPAMEKVAGQLRPIDSEALYMDDMDNLMRQVYSQANRSMAEFDKGDDDFSFAVPGVARFRVNAYRQRGSKAMVVRVVPFEIPDWEKMHIPEEVMRLANVSSGLVLITGAAGCGKSVTQACITNRINQTRQAHIVMLEDPIEYLHRHKQSIISQREVAIDTENYASALRACMRQAPDVIMLGELRDPQTISTAMTAA